MDITRRDSLAIAALAMGASAHAAVAQRVSPIPDLFDTIAAKPSPKMAFANRERDFVGHASAIFEPDQSLGNWFYEAAASITSASRILKLSDANGRTIELASKADFERFINQYLRSNRANMTDRAMAESIFESLGISLPNLIMLFDDVSVAPEGYLVFDATRESPLAKLLELYSPNATYANWTNFNKFYGAGGKGLSEPISVGSAQHMFLSLRPAIHGEIMRDTPQGIFGLDRLEVEAHTDFLFSTDASQRFSALITNEPFRLLDLDLLEGVDWSNEQRVSILTSFQTPVALEKNKRGEYKLDLQPFKEVYLETDDGLLQRNKLSIRVRIRPHQDRLLVQMKRELPPNDVTGLPSREKWERRLRGPAYLADIELDYGQLVSMSRHGFGFGMGMPEIRKLFYALIDENALKLDQALSLRPDHVVVQERTRSRLRLLDLGGARQRLDKLRLMAVAPTAHPNMKRYMAHLEGQVKVYAACNEALARHTRDGDDLGTEPGECVLMSWDKWSVYEPGAVAGGNLPEKLEGQGVRGYGIRTETELDAWTTQPIDEALASIEKKLKEGIGDKGALEKDRDAVAFWLRQLWMDVRTTEQMMAARMLAGGLVKHQNSTLSKSQMAVAMIADGQGGFRRGHRYWF